MAGEVGGWEQWEWDETLFAGAAPFYVQGRSPYAPDSRTRWPRTSVSTAREGSSTWGAVRARSRCVSRTCSRGWSGSIPIGEWWARPPGLRSNRELRTPTWVTRRAEALPAGLGLFRTVTFAASFHWMDRPKVAAAVRTMLEPGGAVVQIHTPASLPSSSLPEQEIADLRVALPRSRPAGGSKHSQYVAQRRGRGLSGGGVCAGTAGHGARRAHAREDGRRSRRVRVLVFVHGAASLRRSHRRVRIRPRALLADASPTGRFEVLLPENVLHIWRLAG